MKKRIKDLILGIIIGSILMMTTPVLADSIIKKIDVLFNHVIVTIDGKQIDGDNILYNGTTYLPIRKVAESFNKDVLWNQENKSVDIKTKDESVKEDIKYQEFIKEFDIQDTKIALFKDKEYFYVEFLYNNKLSDNEFDLWLKDYKKNLNSYINIAFNNLNTYGVLNTIIEFNRIKDDETKQCIGIGINDINGFLIEIQ